MRIYLADKERYLSSYWGEMFRSLDAEIVDEEPDALLCFSVSALASARKAARAWPKAKRVQYVWDIYDWALSRPRPGEYDYRTYIEEIRSSDLVLVPSLACGVQVAKRTGKEFQVVLSGAPLFDAPVRDDGFALNPLRQNPDEQDGWLEKACAELGIPCRSPKHELSAEEYHDLVASCSLVASTYAELSTGGLTCLEAYRLGKPVLGCLGGRNGLFEYLPARMTTFHEGSYEELKRRLAVAWRERKVEDDHREYVDAHFSMTAMSRRLDAALRTL